MSVCLQKKGRRERREEGREGGEEKGKKRGEEREEEKGREDREGASLQWFPKYDRTGLNKMLSISKLFLECYPEAYRSRVEGVGHRYAVQTNKRL